MQAGDTRQTEGARDTPPEGHANREGPCRSKDATTYSSDKAQWSEKKKPLLSHGAQPGRVLRTECCTADRRPGAAQTPTGTRTRRRRHRHTQMHEVSDTIWTRAQGDRCPWKEREAEAPAPSEEMSAAGGEPGSAAEFLERLASLLLFRLLGTESRVPLGHATPRWCGKAGSSPALGVI